MARLVQEGLRQLLVVLVRPVRRLSRLIVGDDPQGAVLAVVRHRAPAAIAAGVIGAEGDLRRGGAIPLGPLDEARRRGGVDGLALEHDPGPQLRARSAHSEDGPVLLGQAGDLAQGQGQCGGARKHLQLDGEVAGLRHLHQAEGPGQAVGGRVSADPRHAVGAPHIHVERGDEDVLHPVPEHSGGDLERIGDAAGEFVPGEGDGVVHEGHAHALLLPVDVDLGPAQHGGGLRGHARGRLGGDAPAQRHQQVAGRLRRRALGEGDVDLIDVPGGDPHVGDGGGGLRGGLHGRAQRVPLLRGEVAGGQGLGRGRARRGLDIMG